MIDCLLLVSLTVLYLGTFIIRNKIVKKRTGLPVRSKDRILKFSILCSSCCFLLAILSTSDRIYIYMGKIGLLRNPFITNTGFILFAASIVMGWYVSASLFHKMVLKEEAYLLTSHGNEYEEYTSKTGRYLPRW